MGGMASREKENDEPEWRAELERVLHDGSDTLTLFGKSLGDAGAAEVADRLRGNASVTGLFVPNNTLGNTGAAALADLLQDSSDGGGTALERVDLSYNDIGATGVAALADGLRQNTSVAHLVLTGNPGVDSTISTEEEAAAGLEALISAIGVNTTLETVDVGRNNDLPRTSLTIALNDEEGRRRGREREHGPLTKAARTND
jgi:Leucine Rich repeat